MKLIENFKNLFKKKPVKPVEEKIRVCCQSCDGKKRITNPFINQYNCLDEDTIPYITCWFCNGDGFRTYTGINEYIALKKEYVIKYANIFKHTSLLFNGAKLINNGRE